MVNYSNDKLKKFVQVLTESIVSKSKIEFQTYHSEIGDRKPIPIEYINGYA